MLKFIININHAIGAVATFIDGVLPSARLFWMFILMAIVMAFMPLALLWSINSLAELGGLAFNIPATVESWFAALVFIIVIRIK